MGVDARLATEGPAGVLKQYAEEPEGASQFMLRINWARSRHAHLRHRSKSFMNNPG